MRERKDKRGGLGRHKSESERRAIVKRYEKSGLTQAEFCRREGVNPWTLRDWRRRIQDEGRSDLFIEVSGRKPESFKIAHKGVSITVPAEFQPEALQLLLKTVAEVEC